MGDVERWELKAGRGRASHLRRAGLAAALWAPVEAWLGWYTAAAATAPFLDTPLVGSLATDWSAVHSTSFFGVLLAGWTVVGGGILGRAVRGGRPEVVVLERRGVRSERVLRGGPRVMTEIPWAQISGTRQDGNGLHVYGTRDFTQIAAPGSGERNREIAMRIQSRLGSSRPPVLTGWLAYLDDAGATLTQAREPSQGVAAVAWGGSALGVTNAVAVLIDRPGDAPWLVLLGVAGLILVGSVAAAAIASQAAAGRPRWTAKPAVVVLTKGPGGPVEFEARSLVAIDRREDGVVTSRLEAVADGNGDVSKGRRVVREFVDGGIRDRAATWLANHAEIPLLTRTEIVPQT